MSWIQGCSPKKKCGTPETRLRQRFLNNLGLRIFGLVLRYSCSCSSVWSRSILILLTGIILHCVSVSNQLQQWTNFCTIFSPKSGRGVGDASPLSKKWRDAVPPCPRPLHTCIGISLHVLRSMIIRPVRTGSNEKEYILTNLAKHVTNTEHRQY